MWKLPRKTNNRTAIWFISPTPGCTPKEMCENTRVTCTHIFICDCVHESQAVNHPRHPSWILGWLSKENMLHIHNGHFVTFVNWWEGWQVHTFHSVLFFTRSDPTQVMELGRKCLYPLSQRFSKWELQPLGKWDNPLPGVKYHISYISDIYTFCFITVAKL